MQMTLDFPRIDLQALSLWLIPEDLTVSTSTKSTLHNYVTNKVQHEIDGLSCQDQDQLRKTAADICTVFVSYFAFWRRDHRRPATAPSSLWENKLVVVSTSWKRLKPTDGILEQPNDFNGVQDQSASLCCCCCYSNPTGSFSKTSTHTRQD